MATPRKRPEDKLKVGRPEVIEGEVLKKLEQAFMMGCSDLESCLYAGISAPTLYNHQNRHPEFLERKNKLKENPFLVARTTVYKYLGDPDHAEWFLERKRKEEFSLRSQVEFNDVSETSKSDLELLKAAIAALPPDQKAALDEKPTEQPPQVNP